MNTPAGWFPQPDGRQRYWDGEKWTEHFAPGVPPVTPPTAAQRTTPLVTHRNWFLRHKVITAIGAVLLIGVISNLASGGTSSKPTSTVAIEPAAESVPTTAVPDQAAADKAAAVRVAADKAAAKAAVASQLGKTVRDGKFAFTVTKVICGIAQVGTNELLIQKAQGQYCRASLNVENIGNEAQTMFASNQYLFDATGRKFSADATANIYDDSAKLMFQEINPGNSIKGFVYFDVPKATKISKLELHDSMFSDGIAVRL